MPPPPGDWSPQLENAAAELTSNEDAWPGGIVPVLKGWIDLFEETAQAGRVFVEGDDFDDYPSLWDRSAQSPEPAWTPVDVVRVQPYAVDLDEQLMDLQELILEGILQVGDLAEVGDVQVAAEAHDDDAEESSDPVAELVNNLHRLRRTPLGGPWWEVPTAEPWLKRSGDGWILHPTFEAFCSLASERANALAPPILTRTYELVIEPASPDTWITGSSSRVRAGVRTNREGIFHEASTLGSGMKSWFGYTIRQVTLDLPRTSSRNDGVRFVLMDEPELHLHPNGQRELADWLGSQRPRGGRAPSCHHHRDPLAGILGSSRGT